MVATASASLLVSHVADAASSATVASEDYPPYAFNRRGRREGYDVAKVQMVLDELKLRAISYPMLRAGMFTALDEGTMDIAFPFNRTPERAAKYILVGPLHEGTTALAVAAADANAAIGLDFLTGRRVGVTVGHTYPAAFEAKQDFTRVPCSSYTLAMRRLAYGRVDAVIGDRAVMEYLVETEGLRKAIHVSKSSLATGPSFCLFPKSRAALAASFEQALARLQAAGRFSELGQLYPTVKAP